jgi:hypothetical protein
MPDNKSMIYLLSCMFLLLGCHPAAAIDTTPPSKPVKLVFIHHSTGANWLAEDVAHNDKAGGLGLALMKNNYVVSDVTYGWGPKYIPEAKGVTLHGDRDQIGDYTDTGNWWNWFRGKRSPVYLKALYAASDQMTLHYSRLKKDPGGENEIIVFKSCFPNSAITEGKPNDPPTKGENPFRGQDARYYKDESVGNIKGVYMDLLEYFKTRQDKLFVLVTPPPQALKSILSTSGWHEDPERFAAEMSANARAVNNWLVKEWLKDYPHKNVAVFDFFNVLTSNGGDAHTNDAGQETGNHHRIWKDRVQHVQQKDGDFCVYPSFEDEKGADSHPSSAGGQKATAEFVPLLNFYYNRWRQG